MLLICYPLYCDRDGSQIKICSLPRVINSGDQQDTEKNTLLTFVNFMGVANAIRCRVQEHDYNPIGINTNKYGHE